MDNILKQELKSLMRVSNMIKRGYDRLNREDTPSIVIADLIICYPVPFELQYMRDAYNGNFEAGLWFIDKELHRGGVFVTMLRVRKDFFSVFVHDHNATKIQASACVLGRAVLLLSIKLRIHRLKLQLNVTNASKTKEGV